MYLENIIWEKNSLVHVYVLNSVPQIKMNYIHHTFKRLMFKNISLVDVKLQIEFITIFQFLSLNI